MPLRCSRLRCRPGTPAMGNGRTVTRAGAPGQPGPRQQTAKGRIAAAFPWSICVPGAQPGDGSALARLETRVALADHEDLATATHDLAVAVTGLRRFQGGQDLHDIPRKTVGTNKPAILAVLSPLIQALAGFFSTVAGMRPYRMPGSSHQRGARMTANEVP